MRLGVSVLVCYVWLYVEVVVGARFACYVFCRYTTLPGYDFFLLHLRPGFLLGALVVFLRLGRRFPVADSHISSVFSWGELFWGAKGLVRCRIIAVALVMSLSGVGVVVVVVVEVVFCVSVLVLVLVVLVGL